MDENKLSFLGRFGLAFLASIGGIAAKMFFMGQYWGFPASTLQYKLAHSGRYLPLILSPIAMIGAGFLSAIVTNLFEAIFWNSRAATVVISLLVGFALGFLVFMYVGSINLF